MRIKLVVLVLALLAVAPGGAADYGLGGVITGGNTSFSGANTLGDLGNVSLGVTAGLAKPTFPVTGVQLTASSVSAVFVAGLAKGRDMGPAVHGLGSCDLWIRAGKVFITGDMKESASLWGLGARLGLLRNSILVPAVSLAVGYHSTGEIPFLAAVGGSKTSHAEFSAYSVRLDVSKNLFFLTPHAGAGLNRSRTKGRAGAFGFDMRETEKLLYAGVEWNLLVLRLGLDVGRTESETFGQFGIRLSL